MKTVPLRGKRAAGRVALIDDEDWPLVAPYLYGAYACLNPVDGKTGIPAA